MWRERERDANNRQAYLSPRRRRRSLQSCLDDEDEDGLENLLFALRCYRELIAALSMACRNSYTHKSGGGGGWKPHLHPFAIGVYTLSYVYYSAARTSLLSVAKSTRDISKWN